MAYLNTENKPEAAYSSLYRITTSEDESPEMRAGVQLHTSEVARRCVHSGLPGAASAAGAGAAATAATTTGAVGGATAVSNAICSLYTPGMSGIEMHTRAR